MVTEEQPEIDVLIDKAAQIQDELKQYAMNIDGVDAIKRCDIWRNFIHSFRVRQLEHRYAKIEQQIIHHIREIEDPDELTRVGELLFDRLGWDQLLETETE